MRGRLLPSLALVCAAGDGGAAHAVLDAALALSGAPPAALLEELLAECDAAITAACSPKAEGSAAAC
jgi:hypothetical protein